MELKVFSTVLFIITLTQLTVIVKCQESPRNVHIGKEVTLGGQPGYSNGYNNGYNNNGYNTNNGYQGNGVHVGKEVTFGQQPQQTYQPAYQQNQYQNGYQPSGTYNGQYHNQNNSPAPYSTSPQLGPCVNNGKLS